MTDIVVDGMTRVAYVPTISNNAAPTTTELNAGILLHSTMTPDGLQGFEAETADVDNSALDSTFDTVTIGRDSFSNTAVMLKKQSGTDTIYDTLTRATTGYIVVRRYVSASTSWASSQKVNVYPIICGQTKEMAPEKNSVARYSVPTKITSSPTLRATVA
jgi:hypothetical protein